MKEFGISDEEIDLRELFVELWRTKWFLLFNVTLFFAGSCIYAQVQSDVFRAKSELVFSFTPYALGVSPIESVPNPLLEEAKKVQPYLNSSIFKEKLATEVDQANDYFLSIEVGFDSKSGVLSIEYESSSPKDVYHRVKLFSEQVNHTWKQIQLDKLLNEKQALDGAIQNAGEGYAMKLLEEKYAELLYKASVLENSNTELVTILEPAQLPLHHVKPKRALIVVLGTMLGAMLGIAIVLIRFSFRRKGQETE